MALEVTDNNFKGTLAEGRPVIIDFWAPWCGPCKMVGPIIEELAGKYEGKVLIDECGVDGDNDTAIEYGIHNIPIVLFFKNGELADRQMGSAPKPTYATKTEALL